VFLVPGLDEGRAFVGRRACRELDALFGERLAQFRMAGRLGDLPLQAHAHVERCAGGGHHEIENDGFMAGHAGLRDGGRIEERGRALLARDTQGDDASDLHLKQRGADRGEHQRHLSADQVDHGRTPAFVRHVQKARVDLFVAEFGSDAPSRCFALGGVNRVAGSGSRQCDELFDRARRHGWITSA
jgi:hypothetical protein